MNRVFPALWVGIFAVSGCGGRSDIFIPEKRTDGSTSSSCGDGVLQPGEECDGMNLGGMTCQALGFGSGALACSSDCTFDTSGCTP